MASWTDVAIKGLDFLAKPGGFGTLIVIMVLVFLVYFTPMAVVAFVSYDNTNRLEAAIIRIGTSCRGQTVATSR